MKFSPSQSTDGAFVEQIANQIMVGMIPVAEFIAGYVPVVKKRIGLKSVADVAMAKEDE
jgi:hypothetical protein